MYELSDYDYTLPEALIAQELASPPDGCKLLLYDKNSGSIKDHIFNELPSILSPKSLLIFNNSKVLKARILFGEYEIFYLYSHDKFRFNCMIGMTIPDVKVGKHFKVGSIIEWSGTDITFYVESISYEGRILVCNKPILEIVEQYGQMPFPPYIKYDKSKENSYQPIFAKEDGSVAAPTASLHFTQSILDELVHKGIEKEECVLHVGLGTFRPVDTEFIKEYTIHSESIVVSKELFITIAHKHQHSLPIIGVGTTVTRTLETLPYIRAQFKNKDKEQFPQEVVLRRDSIIEGISLEQQKKYVRSRGRSDKNTLTAESTLYIYPGFIFRIITGLLTNFHIPKSTLLMMIAAFIGYDEMKKVYDYAIKSSYKFFSFGDAMIILP